MVYQVRRCHLIKIAVNKCYGGFGLSRDALHELRKRGHKGALAEIDIGEDWSKNATPEQREKDHQRAVEIGRSLLREELYSSFLCSIPRDDPELIKLLEEKGSKWVSSPLAEIEITEVPDGTPWQIGEYDGQEWVEEKHRTW